MAHGTVPVGDGCTWHIRHTSCSSPAHIRCDQNTGSAEEKVWNFFFWRHSPCPLYCLNAKRRRDCYWFGDVLMRSDRKYVFEWMLAGSCVHHVLGMADFHRLARLFGQQFFRELFFPATYTHSSAELVDTFRLRVDTHSATCQTAQQDNKR